MVEAPHVRSGYVTYNLYQKLRSHIREIEGKWQAYRLALEVMIIMAYGTGMRLSELLYLRLSDFSDPKKNGNWVIHLAKNRYHDLKSSNAKRTIPLRVLITNEEARVLKRFLPPAVVRMKHPTHLVFHHSAQPFSPLKDVEVSMSLSQLMRSLDGKNDLVFHHFRHTAMSNLQYVIEQEWELFTQHSGHSLESAKSIYKSLIGDLRKRTNSYRMFAFFAGHSSPETTFFPIFIIVKGSSGKN